MATTKNQHLIKEAFIQTPNLQFEQEKTKISCRGKIIYYLEEYIIQINEIFCPASVRAGDSNPTNSLVFQSQFNQIEN